MQTTTPPFKFALTQRLALIVSGENGEAIARSDSTTGEPQYLLRYADGTGRAVECWWVQSALEACEGIVISATTPAAAPATTAPAGWPSIGAALPDGGIFAGITRGADGGPDCMLVLAEAKPADGISWQAAMAWAESLGQGGVWSLPTRAESALLFANLRDQFEPRYYWTCEQYSRYYAWGQLFDDGLQITSGKSFEGRARAVRRLPIQPFNHS